MLTKKWGPSSTRPVADIPRSLQRFPLPNVCLFLGGRLCSGFLRQFVVDVLFEEVLIGANHAAAIYEYGRRAAYVELFAVRAAGIHSRSSFGAGHAALECSYIQMGLFGIIGHLCPGVGGRNNVLIVVDEFIDLPQGVRILLIGASAGNSRRPRPGGELI